MRSALGISSTTDISSAEDASVFMHTLDSGCHVGSLTLEQAKGDLCDDPTTNDGQVYQVDRPFGVMVDEFKISGSDTILAGEVTLKAHGVFQVARLISDAVSGVWYFNTVEGLVAGDHVKLYRKSDGAYENVILDTVNLANQSVEFTTSPSASFTVANDTKMELLPQTPSYQDIETMSFIDTRFYFGDDLTAAASATPENIENWDLTFMNNLEERRGSLRNSPSHIGEKAAGLEISFEKFFENTTDRDRYLRQEGLACIVKITNNKIVSPTDTTQQKYSIIIELSNVVFTEYTLPTGTDELYVAKMTATAFFDNADGRAVRVKVINDNNEAYYTA